MENNCEKCSNDEISCVRENVRCDLSDINKISYNHKEIIINKLSEIKTDIIIFNGGSILIKKLCIILNIENFVNKQVNIICTNYLIKGNLLYLIGDSEICVIGKNITRIPISEKINGYTYCSKTLCFLNNNKIISHISDKYQYDDILHNRIIMCSCISNILVLQNPYDASLFDYFNIEKNCIFDSGKFVRCDSRCLIEYDGKFIIKKIND